MDANLSILLDLAGVAGIFVGFGSLIIFFSGDQAAEGDLHMIRAVATGGLLALIAALLPVLFSGLGLEGRALWATCSAISLSTIWFTILHPTFRPVIISQLRHDRAAAAFFWIFLEVPIQLPLILILFGAFNSYAAGLYVASVVIHLFESAQLLVQVVYARVKKVESSTRRD